MGEVHVKVVIAVDDDYADESDNSGMTEEAHEKFMDALISFGDIVEGPVKVDA